MSKVPKRQQNVSKSSHQMPGPKSQKLGEGLNHERVEIRDIHQMMIWIELPFLPSSSLLHQQRDAFPRENGPGLSPVCFGQRQLPLQHSMRRFPRFAFAFTVACYHYHWKPHKATGVCSGQGAEGGGGEGSRKGRVGVVAGRQGCGQGVRKGIGRVGWGQVG